MYYYGKPCFPVWLLFYGSNVTARAPGTGNAALVEVVDRGRRTDSVVRCVKRRAAWAERHRLGGTAVVLQGPE